MSVKNATLKIEDCDEIVINGKVLKKTDKDWREVYNHLL